MSPVNSDREALLPPLPIATPTSRPFWDGLLEERVRLQRCGGCTRWVFYPRSRCPHCGADALRWHDVSGAATLYTWTLCHRAPAPQFAAWAPYVLAVVELEEQVRMTTLLVDAQPASLRAGMALRPVFDHGDGATRLLFTVDAAAT